MEENKKVKELNPENANPQKYSYEELEQIVIQLTAEYNKMHELVSIKRLDYLFKAIELKEAFSKQCILKCTKEIEEALFGKTEKTSTVKKPK